MELVIPTFMLLICFVVIAIICWWHYRYHTKHQTREPTILDILAYIFKPIAMALVAVFKTTVAFTMLVVFLFDFTYRLVKGFDG